MPILGALLTSLFGSILTFLAAYLTKKIAFGVAAVAAYSTITLALYAVFRSVLNGLNGYVISMPEFWTLMLQISIPPAAPFCFSSYMTVWSACTVYAWQRDALDAFRGGS